ISNAAHYCWNSTRCDRGYSRLLENGAGTPKFSLVAPTAAGGRSDTLRRESSDAALRAQLVERAAVLLGFHGMGNLIGLRRLHDYFVTETAARLGSKSALAICVYGHFRNVLDFSHYHGFEHRAGGGDRSDRFHLSGMVADRRQAIPKRCRTHRP